jgi:hypothetical protein
MALLTKVCAFTSMTSMLKAINSFIPQLLPDFADRTKLAIVNTDAWVTRIAQALISVSEIFNLRSHARPYLALRSAIPVALHK